MFTPSKYPVRLLMQCPHCTAKAAVRRDDKAQFFCSVHTGTPMTVIGVADGAVLSPSTDWPEIDAAIRNDAKAACPCVAAAVA